MVIAGVAQAGARVSGIACSITVHYSTAIECASQCRPVVSGRASASQPINCSSVGSSHFTAERFANEHRSACIALKPVTTGTLRCGGVVIQCIADSRAVERTPVESGVPVVAGLTEALFSATGGCAIAQYIQSAVLDACSAVPFVVYITGAVLNSIKSNRM